MVIESIPLEDELGDVLEKAIRHAGITDSEAAQRAGVAREKIEDAIDYRYDLTTDELRRLSAALGLNEAGLLALAELRYPVPRVTGLPFCLYPLRTPHGIGVANAYVVADCRSERGVLFDAGADAKALRRVWPAAIRGLDAVFITHPESEHVGGLEEVVRQFGPVPVFAPQGAGLERATEVSEGAKLMPGGFEVEVMATPGHAEAHNCYVVRRPGATAGGALLVSGDLLFAGSAGCGFFCADTLRRNLERVLRGLPEDTVVAPGHGPLTTIKNERAFNPFVVSV